MPFLHFVTITFLIAWANCYLVDPPTTAPNDTISDCSNWVVVSTTDTCTGLASENGITIGQFDKYNPSAGSACKLVVGDSYCIEENFGIPPTPSTTSIKTSSKAPTSSGISTPSPIQTGMVSNCNSFYLVASGDQCGTIASNHGITLANFYSWNPAVGSSCTTLFAGDYVCVGIVGQTHTTALSSKASNGITTPLPVQTGMVTNCAAFYLVVAGDQCGAIVSNHGITLANFYLWNPAVGSSCTTLVAGDYVCVKIIGGTTLVTKSTPTSTTPKGNGITTPTPTQAGMTVNCSKFYLVKSGDQCATIASSHDISLASFVAWNSINAACTNLFAGDYVCIALIGASTSTSKHVTTSVGNGVATPTPTQPGITKNCSKFYQVKSGDQCATIASSHGISLASFVAWNSINAACTNLFSGDYVCIALIGAATTTSKHTTTSAGNGVATPTPTQPGITKNCEKFYLVKSGDQCATIASSHSISLASFLAWNTINSACTNLFAGDYVCIALIPGKRV